MSQRPIIMFNCCLIAQIILLITSLNIKISSGYVPDYEAFCGDLALSCITNCPAFQNKCFGTSVADSIRDANSGTISHANKNSPSIPSSPQQLRETCKALNAPCIISKENEPNECCTGTTCVSFRHINGARAAIGSCKLNTNIN